MDVRDYHGRFGVGRRVPHSKETKEKIGFSNKGRKVALETREKIRQKLLGKSYLTAEGRRRISIANSCKKSEITKKRMSIAQKGHPGLDKDKNPSWKGGKLTRMGYVYVKKYMYPALDHIPDFPVDKDGYVKRANAVWFLKTGEVIRIPFFLHHKNGHKRDDSFENLEKTTRSQHFFVHKPKRKKK